MYTRILFARLKNFYYCRAGFLQPHEVNIKPGTESSSIIKLNRIKVHQLKNSAFDYSTFVLRLSNL